MTHRDELPHKSEFAELPHIVLHVPVAQSRRVPIEARAEVIREPLFGVRPVHALGKLARLREDRALRLHPQQVRIRRESDRAVDRALRAALVAVVPLDGARGIPVPERRIAEAKLPLRDRERLLVRRVRDSRGEFGQRRGGRGCLLLLGAQGIGERFAVEFDSGLGEPLVLDGLQRVARRAACGGLVHDLDERSCIWVR